MTVEYLKSILDFDGQHFLWKDNRGYNKLKGKIAGCRDGQGYMVIRIKGKNYKIHRLVWLWHHGYWPKSIDHINHNRTDNRIVNLREATVRENGRNQSLLKNNTSGYNGIHWSKPAGKWQVRIMGDGKRVQLGYFDTLEEAISMRLTANAHYNYHSNHGL